jgi:predicted MFS family arabinose efflux permease
VEHPLLDLSVLARWAYANSLIMIGILMVGLFSVSYYIPQFLQNVQGLTALHAGEMLLPQALVMAVLMPVAGRIYDRFGPRWPALVGLTVNAYGTWLLADLSVDMTHEHLIVASMIRAAGTGLAMMPIMTNGLNALPRSQTGSGSAVNNIMQRVSSALGVAILGVVVAIESAQGDADYGALLPTQGPDGLVEKISSSQDSMIGYYQMMQLHVTANAYDDVLVITTILSAACIPLALMLKKPPRAAAASAGSADLH